jgi:signal transduction histidine kinase
MGLSGPITEQQVEQLRRIKRSQEHLLGIINDILNFSRVEAGQLSYDIGPVVMFDVIDSVMQMLAPQAREKGVTFRDDGCRRDVIALADRPKVEQIVLNIVSNAVKFTPSGGSITLACETLGDDRVVATVRDTGCGIPADQLDKIFEPFVQVGRTLAATREGAGLGLAISRDLARAMDGDVTVKSTVDVGSEFRIVLPRA